MKIRPNEFVQAARVPESVRPQEFGPWQITRCSVDSCKSLFEKEWLKLLSGFENMTMLRRFTEATMHLEYGEVVMEDSATELRRHLSIWMNASGNVLVTGLGLGCVVRGLQLSPDVEKITVIEIDRMIIDVIGPEFESDSRVRIVHCDALEYAPGNERFDYAWHDLWTDGNKNLQLLHAQLVANFRERARFQGAWNFPKMFKRRMPAWFLR